MDEMKEFIKAGTEFFKTATVYLNMKATAEKLIAPANNGGKKETAAKTAKPAAGGKSAAKTVADALADAGPQMSEKESLDTAMKLATKYIQDGNKEERKAELIAHLKEKYEKANISALTHLERVEFIEHVKGLDSLVPAEL